MNRIVVTGNAGAGKSTIARHLASELEIPYHSLDRVVWEPGWKKTPPPEKQRRLDALTHTEEWVIDGVSLDVQTAADCVVFLDVPRRLCFLRAMKRNSRYLFHSRPELPPRCPEIMIIPTLIRIIWNFPAKIRPRILAQAMRFEGSQDFFHIREASDIPQCLESLMESRKPMKRRATQIAI